MIDQALWMLPFTTKTDLEESAKQADVSVERRSDFLERIRAEHSHPGARAQLQELWSHWLKRKYPGHEDGRISIPQAATPPDDEDTAEGASSALATAEGAAASLPERMEVALSAVGTAPLPAAPAASATARGGPVSARGGATGARPDGAAR